MIEDSDGISQGTAFFLREVGLVTCSHCVGTSPFIYHPSKPHEKVAVKWKAGNKVVDIAVLEVVGDEPKCTHLEPNSFGAELFRGDDVLVLGYPNHAAGKEMSIKGGQVTSFNKKSGIRRFNVSCSIVAGNSGGPVFNRSKRVIGIAVTGADNEIESDLTEAHGVIPISAITYAS